MLNTKMFIFAGAVILLFFIIFGFWYLREGKDQTKGFALMQETPDWADWQKKLPAGTNIEDLYSQQTPIEQKPGIVLRYAENGSNILLLKHSIGDGVYSFDKSSGEIKKSTDEMWQKATGEIIFCNSHRWTRQQVFKIDNRNYKFFRDDRENVFPIYGNYAVDAFVSPNKNKAGVLSAYGPKRPWINFGWVGLGDREAIRIYGQRYAQVLNLPAYEYADAAVKLYSDKEIPCFALGWAADEKVLVAYECNFYNFQIVEPFYSNKS